MSVFGESYAGYYDLFYANKDYAAEAAFVREVIQRHKPNARSILDLGCGSARHAVEFARAGLTVTGVERSGSNSGSDTSLPTSITNLRWLRETQPSTHRPVAMTQSSRYFT
jgi:SAM-dependent methyltransferase